MAFVEYQDVRYAAQAMATLQGSFLLSSDRGAIRIEYAKSKMAEVGFTNLWSEVGSTLCYDRPRCEGRGGGSICEIGGRLLPLPPGSAGVLEILSGCLFSPRRSAGHERRRGLRKILACAGILAKAFLAGALRMPSLASMRMFVAVKRCSLRSSEAFEHPEYSLARLSP